MLAGCVAVLEFLGGLGYLLLDTAAALVQGQHALLASDLAGARAHLERAVVRQRQGRLPAFLPDARVSLAACCAAQGELGAAAAWLDQALAEVALDAGLGALLLEPPGRLQALWSVTEDRLQAPPAVRAALRRRLAAWQGVADGRDASNAAAPPDDLLSEREREVLALLAEGQSNKLIARGLDISMHTVKRHVANILTKLALDSRTQAAAYWHRR